jgi:hypothetical protein
MARNILLKIYYELEYYEMAKTMIDTYRHFVGRDAELPEAYKESVYSFLKLYNRLIDIKINKDLQKLDGLKLDIRVADNIILKQWLLDVTGDIKTGVLGNKKGAN